MPDGSLTDLTADPPSGWHSIRPWNPQLSLHVREITSVSATFILATNLNGEIDSSLAILGFNAAAEDEDENNDDEDTSKGQQPENKMIEESSSTTSSSSSTSSSLTSPNSKKSQSLIADMLSKGLKVSVNGVNWQRVLIRIDEKVDEAVIIVYGLMPGRQYDIDLALVHAGQQQASTVRRQVLTFDEHSDLQGTGEMSNDPDSYSYDHSNSSSSDPTQSLSTPSTSPNRTIPNTPPPLSASPSLISASSSTGSAAPNASPPQISLEERLNQLHHNLSLINAERDTLLTSLKSARRESQKADAAIRAEMDALKRASEKHGAGEARAKQKILALQEAVKRAQSATKETESLAQEINREVPSLLEQKAAKESEYLKIKQEADKVGKTRESEVEKDRKRHEAMRAELASLTHKLEKLTGKKEKQENVTMPDLEQQLKETEEEIEEEERFLEQMEMNREFEDVNRMALGSVGQQQQQSTVVSSQLFPSHQSFGDHPTYVPVQRTRHQSLNAMQSYGGGPGPISRPSLPAPIQRPVFSSSTPSAHANDGITSNRSTMAAMTPSLPSPSTAPFAGQPQPQHTASSIWSAPPRQTQAHPGRSNSLNRPSQQLHHSHTSHYRDSHHHQHQSQQQPQQVPVILTNPARRGSIKSNTSSTSSPSAGTASNTIPPTPAIPSSLSSSLASSTSSPIFVPSTSSANSPSPALSVSSTLSSRAPAFEPGRRGLGLKISTSVSTPTYAAPRNSGNSATSPTRPSASVGVIGAGRR